jgi:hypothetical protein
MSFSSFKAKFEADIAESPFVVNFFSGIDFEERVSLGSIKLCDILDSEENVENVSYIATSNIKYYRSEKIRGQMTVCEYYPKGIPLL